MKNMLKVISLLGLVVLLASPVLELTDQATVTQNQWGIGIGTVLWFATAPFWIGRRNKPQEA